MSEIINALISAIRLSIQDDPRSRDMAILTMRMMLPHLQKDATRLLMAAIDPASKDRLNKAKASLALVAAILWCQGMIKLLERPQ